MQHLFGSSASLGPVIVVVVLAFGALVVIHELGHFAVARLARMRVDRFSVGFGPVLLRTRRRDTEWALSALPFGGYVKIAGMAPGDAVEPGDRGAYANHPAWHRLFVIAGGPAMNYFFAVALATVMLATFGFREPDPGAVVGQVLAGGAAERGGLLPGDRVVALDGRAITTWDELVSAVVAHPNKPLRLEVSQHEGPARELVVTPEAANGRGRLGIAQSTRLVRTTAGGAVVAAFRLTNERAAEILSGLGQMVTGRQRAELRGPVGIAQEMARSARAGVAPFITIVWFISVALALFNLLPIPALDGGRLVFLFYEIVTRRRVDERVENIVHLAGFVALFGLLLAVTLFGDLARIIRS